MNFEAGDRVEEKYLGKGIVIQGRENKRSFDLGLVLVKYDKAPDYEYNMGYNPCWSFVSELKKIEEV